MYPLIGASRFGWRFTAADNDSIAIGSANNILSSNPKLKALITVRDTSCTIDKVTWKRDQACASRDRTGSLACAAASQSYDFCVCNPPFFAQDSDSCQGNAVYGGVSSEMVCVGGELEFVRSMVSDSLMMHTTGKSSCHWYTAMLGKKSSFKKLRTLVHQTELVTVVRTSELVQGKLSRWVLAWSFTVSASAANIPLRPVQSTSGPQSASRIE